MYLHVLAVQLAVPIGSSERWGGIGVDGSASTGALDGDGSDLSRYLCGTIHKCPLSQK